ncbi:conserved exported hypothetical protein [Gammaproteobacteria bacterium]
MKKFFITLLFFVGVTTNGHAASELWKNAGQACVFGGSVLGVTSIVVLYPAIAVGTNNLPVTSLILGNTLFGCGISAIGASAAHAFGWAYDRVFGLEPEPPEAAKSTTTTEAPLKSPKVVAPVVPSSPAPLSVAPVVTPSP